MTYSEIRVRVWKFRSGGVSRLMGEFEGRPIRVVGRNRKDGSIYLNPRTSCGKGWEKDVSIGIHVDLWDDLLEEIRR